MQFLEKEVVRTKMTSVSKLGRTIIETMLMEEFGLDGEARRALAEERKATRVPWLEQATTILGERARRLKAATKASARKRAGVRVHLDRFTSGISVYQNWFLTNETVDRMGVEAERSTQGSRTRFCLELLNLYSSYYPLPADLAERLERERLEQGLTRLEYLRGVWWEYAERRR